MAISRAMSSSLDSLRDAILEANEFLQKSIGATEVSVHLKFLDGPEPGQQAFLVLVSDELSVEYYDESSDSRDSTAVLALPVVTRIKVAEQIPKFIEEVNAKLDELPLKISETVEAIRKSIKEGR